MRDKKDRVWVEDKIFYDHDETKELFLGFYKKLFTSKGNNSNHQDARNSCKQLILRKLRRPLTV